MAVSFNLRAIERADLPADHQLDRGVTEELPDIEEIDGTSLLSFRENLVAAELTSPFAVPVERKSEEIADLLMDEEDPLFDSPLFAADEDREDEMDEKYSDAPEELAMAMSDDDFIEYFLGQNNVTVGYRWTSVREGQLVGALLQKRVRTQATVMIQKIKAYLSVRAAAIADDIV